ncbi:hypothetical protein N7519_005103 [Penicillium mononematosum]|uniref:uncharacterized protein n=1 Tax=Penicillium mononematosum TaxID=268346 RepID=UPI00254970B3|nr:uncharacterized protein N7519_005103 [Penicillium mononematosum]KAJ6183802.1 hypothetical protein N7519_005103 [Penicillium mononematosum]
MSGVLLYATPPVEFESETPSTGTVFSIWVCTDVQTGQNWCCHEAIAGDMERPTKTSELWQPDLAIHILEKLCTLERVPYHQQPLDSILEGYRVGWSQKLSWVDVFIKV